MARFSDMWPDDRQNARDVMRALLPDLDLAGRGGHMQLARCTAAELARLEMQGCEWAGRVRKASSTDGLLGLAQDVLDEDQGTMKIRASGQRVPIKLRVGQPLRDAQTRKVVEWVQINMFDLPRQRFIDYARGERSKAEQQTDKALALMEGVKLLEAYPTAPTLRVACDQAGIDPLDFELPDAI
jgi:hypothetical protein